MRLAEALRELVAALKRAKVEYALVGGLAASARGEARFTRDLDVLSSTFRIALARLETANVRARFEV